MAAEKLKVLIVDDDVLIRTGLAFVINAQKDMQAIGPAANGVEALAIMAETKPDIVLMDLQMPEMDGISCIKEIRKRDADLPILILSVYNEEEHVIQGLLAGANGYLLKKADFSFIVRMIRDAANGQYTLPDEIAARIVNFIAKKENPNPPSGGAEI
ncbi:MAG TPA: response regulator transcription factor [Bacilli bacterium]